VWATGFPAQLRVARRCRWFDPKGAGSAHDGGVVEQFRDCMQGWGCRCCGAAKSTFIHGIEGRRARSHWVTLAQYVVRIR